MTGHHEYWECENPDHNMFFQWNRIEIKDHFDCAYDWARFAWGTDVDEQEQLCDENNQLTSKQRLYRDTGGNKIQWDFDTDGSEIRWGAEAQIICKDPADIKCIDGFHDCAEGAECYIQNVSKPPDKLDTLVNVHQVVSNGMSKYLHPLVVPLVVTGTGTNSDP